MNIAIVVDALLVDISFGKFFIKLFLNTKMMKVNYKNNFKNSKENI